MVEIKLNHQDAVILHQVLKNLKPHLESELEKSSGKGTSVIAPDWVRRVYEDALDQLDAGTD